MVIFLTKIAPASCHTAYTRCRKLKWQRALHRHDLPKNVLVCSTHFVDGRPTARNPTPSLNLGYKAPVKVGRRLLKRKFVAQKLEMVGTDGSEHEKQQKVVAAADDVETLNIIQTEPTMTSFSTQTSITESRSAGTQWIDPTLHEHEYARPCISGARDTGTQTRPSETEDKGVNCSTLHIPLTTADISSDSLALLYTGLPLNTFRTFVSVMQNMDDSLKFTMPVSEQVLLVLMKLRFNLLFADLANRFGISESYACTIFNQRLSFMASKLKNLIVWLPRETIRATMPKSFCENYPKTTVIIDCAETFIQRAKNLKTRGETYSHCKSNNTGKYLVGIAPHGQIMFISKGFGGRSSDNAIVEESGIFNYLLPGDEIMTDRGFTIDDLLFPLKVKLNIPAFTKGKEEDVTETRRIATVRIHVERAIRRLKVIRMLSQVVPVTSVKKLSDYLIVCAALVNLRSDLIKDKDDN
ncbi:uncharacterized protein LOC125664649 [Ostrea edulis]|uniref:uncharacterized protein LOC125664649 n=1 Tax=Ostrea edulis TaxID=37623 RepID=UPI0024AECB4A|nr:uncharacterized protein LOC125664649 [Ostrea edulis]